jgi:hypothetical protein
MAGGGRESRRAALATRACGPHNSVRVQFDRFFPAQ